MTGTRQGRLLLVEDETRLRELVSLFLRFERFEVVEAEDGLRGVERHGNSGPFDLVIVDLDLPKLPGIEVCRRIRKSRPDQPILVCSAAILDPHLAALGGLGIDRILTKPYLPARLIGEIANVMSMPSLTVSTANSTRVPKDDPRWRPPPAHSSGVAPHSLVKITQTK